MTGNTVEHWSLRAILSLLVCAIALFAFLATACGGISGLLQPIWGISFVAGAVLLGYWNVLAWRLVRRTAPNTVPGKHLAVMMALMVLGLVLRWPTMFEPLYGMHAELMNSDQQILFTKQLRIREIWNACGCVLMSFSVLYASIWWVRVIRASKSSQSP